MLFPKSFMTDLRDWVLQWFLSPCSIKKSEPAQNLQVKGKSLGEIFDSVFFFVDLFFAAGSSSSSVL